MIARTALIVSLAASSSLALAGDPAKDIKTIDQKAGYALGYQLGMSLKNQGLEVEPVPFSQGIADALKSVDPRLPVKELQDALVKYQQKRMEARKKLAAENQEKGDKYRAAFKKEKGVVETASGLEYKVITKGNGPKPKADDTVVVHYRGTLVNGKEFDSSYKRGKPTTFQVKNVIPGWQEALKLMPAGSKWKIVVPPHLAYGAKGFKNAIGPNETLTFDVELLEVKKAGGGK